MDSSPDGDAREQIREARLKARRDAWMPGCQMDGRCNGRSDSTRLSNGEWLQRQASRGTVRDSESWGESLVGSRGDWRPLMLEQA